MYNNSVILVAGGTGSWGQELIRQLLKKYNPKEVRIYSRGEFKQVEMRHTFDNNPKLKFIIGDIRDKCRLMMACRGVDYVFHLAALKHVPIGESDSIEFVKTNILGTQNIIEAAIENNVKKVIFSSTDKAVDAYNLYGSTKAVAEKLIISANTLTDKTKFVCIRGGNVLGTSGSVIPLFRQQILKANTITLTDENMTRYILTLNQAISFLLNISECAYGGEICVMKMPDIRIIDLAEVMIEVLGNKNTKIKKIGIRSGEKIDEVLISKCESSGVIERDDYFIIMPTIKIDSIEKNYKNAKIKSIGEYTSRNSKQLTKAEIKSLLVKEGYFDVSTNVKPKDADIFQDMSKDELLDYFKKEGWITR